ncbi:3-epi-6-deoxocathasterone 23-monooxygenase-like [Canna indica]|uniref:3-epi-6-deoxocathasterone 23-monooxygenase-like n=1 Tax=Canna indica TaxID=4628 RepID=A0AAQ3QJQ5_9LILI|nr:3-epi-6-deoxocathasterone 23-monooxygenase-like [Canna indica]
MATLAPSYDSTSRPPSFYRPWFLANSSRFGKVFRTHILGKPIIISTDAEVNKVVLQNADRAFVPSYPKSVIEVMGRTSILQMRGDYHKRVHGIVSKFLKSTPLLERVQDDMLKAMNLAFSTWKHSNKKIYIQDETNKITFELLLQILLGTDPGSQETDFLTKEFMELIKGIICIPVIFPGTTLYKSLKAKERMANLITEMIRDKVESGAYKALQYFIDVLIDEFYDAKDQATSDLICNMIIEMMIPGSDSVPMIMTLAIKHLGDYPDTLKQILEENMELKRRKEEAGESYEWSDYLSLSFTQNVINETLRMANIVNSVWRKAEKDVEIKGHLIPEGWSIAASFSSVHFDEENYENPFEFSPSRWDNKGGINQSTFTPFGGGQRLCPGYVLAKVEISIFLHHFLTSFRDNLKRLSWWPSKRN